LKVHEYNQGPAERKVVGALIMRDRVLAQVVPKWHQDMLSSQVPCIVVEFAVEHYKKFGASPKTSIKTYYEEWAVTHNNDLAEQVGNYLQSVSDEWAQQGEDPNDDHLIDFVGTHLNTVRYRKVADGVLADLNAGQLDKAKGRISSCTPVELGSGAYCDFLTDESSWDSLYERKTNRQLIEFPDPSIARFFANELETEGFLGICGPQKSSKSFTAIELAIQAVSQRRRTAFFAVGDMSEHQVQERIATRLTAHPHRSPDGKWPCVIKIPSSISSNGEVQNEEALFKTPCNKDTMAAAFRKFMSKTVRSGESYFRMACFPNLSISILGIKSILDSWSLQGWDARCIVVDYFDNLMPVTKTGENRDKINETWKLGRALAQDKKACLITPTQVKAAGFGVRWLGREHFSEDNRKLSHVTGMMGINQYGDEKGKNVVRWNWIVKREGEFNHTSGPTIAQCLSIANPCVKSTW
jgi:hypothetical protein